MNRLKRNGTAELVSRDQFLRRERVEGNIHFPSSADHEQDWQPYSVDPYSRYMCYHTFFFLKFAPEKLVSRDGFGSPVPRQPGYLDTQPESGAYLRDIPRRGPFIILTAIRHRVSPEFIGSRPCVPMAFTAESPPARAQ